MKHPLQRYLEKRADLESRPLVSRVLDGIEQVVVIPIRAEMDYLPRTLETFAQNPADDLARTLVIGVVNNPPPSQCGEDVVVENLRTLELLRGLVEGTTEGVFAGLRVACVDAATDGHEFGAREGVGLARKIGLDWGLDVLRRNRSARGLLICLDADTRVEPNYLEAIRAHFEQESAWAAITAYAHPIEGPREQQAAILCYEFFLRYHVLGLRYARSPYAFHAIGSTMACTADAYVAVSGMNRRRGGEDFYFLQQLAKTGNVDTIHTTTVHPSPRPSWRVPIGTGPRVQRFIQGTRDEYVVDHPDTYEILRKWLAELSAQPSMDSGGLLAQARAIEPALESFLRTQNFERNCERLQKNAPDEAGILAQFHRWFDGLKSLQLIHYLRDHGYPKQEMFESIGVMLARTGLPHATVIHDGIIKDNMHGNLEAQTKLLDHLRSTAVQQHVV